MCIYIYNYVEINNKQIKHTKLPLLIIAIAKTMSVVMIQYMIQNRLNSPRTCASGPPRPARPDSWGTTRLRLLV